MGSVGLWGSTVAGEKNGGMREWWNWGRQVIGDRRKKVIGDRREEGDG